MDQLFAGDRSGRSVGERSQRLLALIELQERVSAAVVQATAEWHHVRGWEADGVLSPVPWLKHRAHMAGADARSLMRSARLVDRSPDIAKLLDSGDITVGHVDAVARHVTPPRAELFDQHSDALLDAARSLSPDDTAAVACRWAAYADDALNRGEPEQLHARRGVWFRRVGDVEEARVLGPIDETAVLGDALDRLEPPDAKTVPGGPRTLAQRRFDALMRLARGGLADRDGRIDPAHAVNVVIDAETLAGEFNPDGRCEILGHGSVLPQTVRRLICDSWLSRVVMNAKAEVLEMGRAARLFTQSQRRAIMIRDGGCALACCDRPPGWCDVHHIDAFGPPTNGLTDIDNGIGLCRPHHTLVHEYGWKLYRADDGNWYLEPP